MKGLIEEADHTLQRDGRSEELLDAILVGCAQRIEHYEIAAYGAARAISDALGEEEIADLLDRTLAEESATDERLSAIIEEEILPDLARIELKEKDEE
jgi:ferritin-like metal-binding protein YciE